jgi:tetratricopeptide (TPR) repeat protein
MAEVGPVIEEGERLLAAGDWSAAEAAFRSALEIADTARALAGLGDALWWLGQVPAGLECRERAYGRFRREAEHAAAAEVAVWLAIDYRSNLGNRAAAHGWLARARRLVDDHQLTPLRGWVLLGEAHLADPVPGESRARQAYQIACDQRDPDLQLCALSQIGTALIGQGRITEGVAYLDESMAGALGGEWQDPGTVVFAGCNTIKSCISSAQLERANQWIHAADRFTRRYGCPFLYAQCRTGYGTVLMAAGDWARAEQELRTALDLSTGALPAVHTPALATLAGLRLEQGRVEEAERLVAGLDDQPATVPVVARIHLVRDRPASAQAVLHRRLAELGDDQLTRMELMELLGQAELEQDRAGAALARGKAMTTLGEDLGCEVAAARGLRLCGRALAARARRRARTWTPP